MTLHSNATDYDGDTGLLSRDGLMTRVHELITGEGAGHACLVIRLEIDAGEVGWIAHGAAAAITASTRLGDLVARLGTVDFAVVARETDAIGARRLAERISASIRDAFEKPARRLRVRVVVGYEMVSAGAADVRGGAESLVRRAGAAALAGVPDGNGRWIGRYDRGTHDPESWSGDSASCATEAAAV